MRKSNADVYVIPNGQPSIPSTAVITTDVNSGTVEAHFVEVREFDGLAELRTVPVNEYHQLEGIKLLEKAKSSGDPSDKVMHQSHELTLHFCSGTRRHNDLNILLRRKKKFPVNLLWRRK